MLSTVCWQQAKLIHLSCSSRHPNVMPSRRGKSRERSSSVNRDNVNMTLTPVQSLVKTSTPKKKKPKKKVSVKQRLGKRPTVDGSLQGMKKKKKKNRHFYRKKKYSQKKNGGGNITAATTIINVSCSKTIINKK